LILLAAAGVASLKDNENAELVGFQYQQNVQIVPVE
jgi:hypothetical protein